MKLQPFKGIVKKIDYKIIQPKNYGDEPKYYSTLEIECFENEYGEMIDSNQYYALVQAQEIRKGRRAKKHNFEIAIFIEEETFDAKPIEVGDIIKISDANLFTRTYTERTYNAEKIADGNARLIKKDSNGKPFLQFKTRDCKLTCSNKNWSIAEKSGEFFYFSIGKVKFFTENKGDLLNFNNGEWYIDDAEFEKLKEFDDGEIVIRCYAHKQIIRRFKASIEIFIMEDCANKHILKVVAIEEVT